MMYALYKGEIILATGTIYQIAEKMNIKARTVLFYGTKSYLKRASGKGDNNRVLVKI